MTRLSIYPEGSASNTIPSLPLLESSNSAVIKTELESRGIEFQHWPVKVELNKQASEAEILAIYTAVINRVQADGRYPTVDAIRMKPDHPQRERLRQKFLAEHIHAEDEVRFFVEGCGLFCLHINDEVLQVLCEKKRLDQRASRNTPLVRYGQQAEFLCSSLLQQSRRLGCKLHR